LRWKENFLGESQTCSSPSKAHGNHNNCHPLARQ
jgi:hypothetical protein